jgi:hypothetical protein
MPRTITGYRVMDLQSQTQVGKDYARKSGARASRRAEKLNLEWGAHRYDRRPIWTDEPSGEAQPHACKSVATPDGKGAYCGICGETLA